MRNAVVKMVMKEGWKESLHTSGGVTGTRRKVMTRSFGRAVAVASLAMTMALSVAWAGTTDDAKTPYPKMAAVEQYMMDRNAEIALARSAAPPSISQDAEVQVLGPKGYEIAVKGKNGFVCIVDRSWAVGIDERDFWNPKLRGPLCLNAPAARAYIPIERMKAELILAGKSKEQMAEAINAAFDKKELKEPESGSMCYMMAKEGYLNDAGKNWHPHLMFLLPQTDAALWGAESKGSPVLVAQDKLDRITIFMIIVEKWSDGTPGPPVKEDEM
jgi:hypothetical protein